MPERTCVACGSKQPKEELLRYVWGGETPVLDSSKKAPGRGAYCCDSSECLKRFGKQQKKWKRIFRL